MKTITPVFILLLYCLQLQAQNLVPNPGFEEYNACPYSPPTPNGYLPNIAYSPAYDSFPTVLGWVNPLLSSTPDYFNICDTIINGHGVPFNVEGYQLAHTGEAYTGIYTYVHQQDALDDYREYIEAKILQPLIVGHKYMISFYVSPTASQIVFGSPVFVDKIGAYLSDSMINADPPYQDAYISVTPSIESPQGVYISDTSGWTKISGIYTAQGGEQWITLGHFLNGPQTDSFLVNYEDSDEYSYIYIDDVCVMDMTANTHDTTMCVSNLPTTITGIDAPGSYLWNTGDTTATLQVSEPGTYWRRATGDCLYYTDTITVAVIPSAHLGNDTSVCGQTPLPLNTNAQPGVHYQWSTGDTTCCITATSSGLYTVQASNMCGVSTDSIQVTMYTPCDECVWAPSAFTPNNDGKNDVFKVVARCPLQYYSISIFNRWGQQVFTATTPEDSWDGTYKGVQQEGVFFYYITYQTNLPNATKEMLKGDVTVIR
jgi:gliding motility-associated-like protein